MMLQQGTIPVSVLFNSRVFVRNATVSLCSTYRKCQKVLGKNMDLWENEVYRFKTIGQLKVLYSKVLHTEINFLGGEMFI